MTRGLSVELTTCRLVAVDQGSLTPELERQLLEQLHKQFPEAFADGAAPEEVSDTVESSFVSYCTNTTVAGQRPSAASGRCAVRFRAGT